MGISLDISNAFNSIPWDCILGALKYHKVPRYLQRIIRDYFRGRNIQYTGRNAAPLQKIMERGVPQGSVLGPLLWNIGYNWVLRGALPPGLGLTCYADDTLIMARAEDWEQILRLAELGAKIVVRRIRMLGLDVATHKTEVLWFCAKGRRPPSGSKIWIEEAQIEVKPNIKYLGLVIDSTWSFVTHFRTLTPRLRREVAAFGRVLPNIGGPGAGCRHLYAAVISSIALYGAPVWHHSLRSNRRSKNDMMAVQRTLALRLVRGYRTISLEAALILAGQLPWDLQAENRASMYKWRAETTSREGLRPSPAEVRKTADELRLKAIAEWQEALAQCDRGKRVVEATRPMLERWLERPHGTLTFRLTQVLSGHGCFGEYLCNKARRERTARCHSCGGEEDTAQHTLGTCPAWAMQRRALFEVLRREGRIPWDPGGNPEDNINVAGPTDPGTEEDEQAVPPLSILIEAMIDNEKIWKATTSFCEEVMALKEADELRRELDPDADPIRRRRRELRRRRFTRLQP